MKYPYAVKANGKWYRPNEEVPEPVAPETPAAADEKAEPTTADETPEADDEKAEPKKKNTAKK